MRREGHISPHAVIGEPAESRSAKTRAVGRRRTDHWFIEVTVDARADDDTIRSRLEEWSQGLVVNGLHYGIIDTDVIKVEQAGQ